MTTTRDRKLATARAKAQAGKDIARLMKPVKNKARRESCQLNFRLFCETYLPETFYNDWSPDHLTAIGRIEDAAIRGELFALAMPRGNGKSSLCKAAVLWATLFAHCRYAYIIAANAGKAQDILEAVKTWIRFQKNIGDDFPEVCIPFIALDGIAQRSGGQMIDGIPTRIKYDKDTITFPHVEDAYGNPFPTSNLVIGSSGLTGDGIRGSAKTTMGGETLRPDLVIIDDPQTDESAGSVSQNATREKLISGAVLGMAGPDKKIAGIMPCTVIEPDDMVDRILDPAKFPMWRGSRFQMLPSMPVNMNAWEQYYAVYRECFASEKIDYERINKYYREHKEELEEGAGASWEQRKDDDEETAIQHAMHLYFRDEAAFFAEYQNTPKARDMGGSSILPWQDICRRINTYKQNEIPANCNHIIDMIDVQGKCLWYCRVAFADDGTGYVFDYGSFPDQHKDYYVLSKMRETMQRRFADVPDLESQIYLSLKEMCDKLLEPVWREDGLELRTKRILIDSAWGQSTKTVYRFCREFGRSEVLSFRGRGIGASSCPMAEFKPTVGEILGNHWYLTKAKDYPVRRFDSDVNYWKTETHRRISKQAGEVGGITLFKASPEKHRMIAEQLTSEKPVRVNAVGRDVDEWKLPNKSRDNHLLDCLAGCVAGADAENIRPRQATVASKNKSERIKKQNQTRKAKYL